MHCCNKTVAPGVTVHASCSNCPPSAAAHARSRFRHSFTAPSIMRWSRRSHSSTMRWRSFSTFAICPLLIPLHDSPYRQSTGLRSWLLGGHKLGWIKLGVTSFSNSTVSRALLAGASSVGRWNIPNTVGYPATSLWSAALHFRRNLCNCTITILLPFVVNKAYQCCHRNAHCAVDRFHSNVPRCRNVQFFNQSFKTT